MKWRGISNESSQLARTGSGTDRDLTQVQALRDAGAADLRASVEQIQMKAEAIAIAEAEVHMAEANLENAQAIVEQKQAALDQAELDLDRTVIRAPIDGIIIKRDVNPGQTVAVSLEAKTLFKIANDLREMEVHGKIDEADVGQLKVGQTAQFTVDAYPDQTFRGRVQQIRKSPEVVQNVVTYTTIISAPNPDLLLLPGMTAQLRIVVSDSGGILKIPSQALRFRPNGASCVGSPECEPGRFLQGVRDCVGSRRRRATEPGRRKARRERRQRRSTAGGPAYGRPASDHRGCQLTEAKGLFRRPPGILRCLRWSRRSEFRSTIPQEGL